MALLARKNITLPHKEIIPKQTTKNLTANHSAKRVYPPTSIIEWTRGPLHKSKTQTLKQRHAIPYSLMSETPTLKQNGEPNTALRLTRYPPVEKGYNERHLQENVSFAFTFHLKSLRARDFVHRRSYKSYYANCP